MRRPKATAKLGRDTILFIAGLAGIANETLLQHAERPTLLILFGGMVGLPAFLRADHAGEIAKIVEPDAPTTSSGSSTRDEAKLP